jgi:hypothetical protein
LPAEAAAPEPDDFSWLTGDTVPAPEPGANDERKPGVSPAFAETVNLKRDEPQAEPPAQELQLSEEPHSAAEAAEGTDVLANPPEADPQDFSWLDNAKDEPLNFSAFDEGGTPSIEPPSGSSPSADSNRTTVQQPGPTVKLSKTEPPAAPPDVALPPAAFLAVDPQQAAEPEDVNDNADAVSPAEYAASEEGIPDFAALAHSTSDEMPGLPKMPADRPAVGVSPTAGATSPPRAAGKGAKPKGWWPFAAKKKDAVKPKAPVPDESPAPVEVSAEPEDAAPAPPAAPEFDVPAAEEPVPEQAVVEESTGEDDNLSQFFKSLK